MGKLKKKILFLTLLLILFVFIIPLTSVQAATPYMEKLNLKFDLEENTWTTIRTNWAGNVWVKSRAMIKNIKVKNDSKKGYNKLTCDIFFERFKSSKSQVKKILHSKYFKKYEDVGSGECHWWVYDYFTGDDGLKENYVKIKQKITYGKFHKNKDSDGCWFGTCDYKFKLTITYPENYKNLCIGVSGNGSYKYVSQNDYDDDFDIRKHPVYKKDKKYIHFMRIN